MALYHHLAGAAALVAAAFSGAAWAQAAAQETTNLAASESAPAMWRVADGDSEFFLFGTFHFLKPGAAWRSDTMNEAFARADTVYFEVETDAPRNEAIARNVFFTKGLILNGPTLSEMLDVNDAQKLVDVTQSLGLQLSDVNAFRPWRAFLTLSIQFIMSKGFEPGAGADSVLLAEARALGKDLKFFETLEQQLALFTELDPEAEKNLLVVTLRDWDQQDAAFDALFTAWRTGDEQFLDIEMNDVMRDQAPKVHQRIMTDRNRAWVETLDAALSGGAGTAFIAVGAGHLVGDENSVPALLAQRGYNVSRYGAHANDNTNDN